MDTITVSAALDLKQAALEALRLLNRSATSVPDACDWNRVTRMLSDALAKAGAA